MPVDHIKMRNDNFTIPTITVLTGEIGKNVSESEPSCSNHRYSKIQNQLTKVYFWLEIMLAFALIFVGKQWHLFNVECIWKIIVSLTEDF